LIPDAEAPGRLALVLLTMLNAPRALGVDEATTWMLVTKAALDRMPAIRRTVLEALQNQTSAATSDLAEKIGYPTMTARRALEDLGAHGVVDRTSVGPGKADLWSVSALARGRWPDSQADTFSGKPPHELGEGIREDEEHDLFSHQMAFRKRSGGDTGDACPDCGIVDYQPRGE